MATAEMPYFKSFKTGAHKPIGDLQLVHTWITVRGPPIIWSTCYMKRECGTWCSKYGVISLEFRGKIWCGDATI